MIEVGDVLESYDSLITSGLAVRRDLVANIYKLTKSVGLEDSCFSKEALLRIKFIVSIHDEVFKNINLEKEQFQDNCQYLQRCFYRNIEYAKIYSEVEYFQALIFEYEGLKDCCSEFSKIPVKSEPFNEMDRWISNRLLINEYELDMYEEEIATRLTKVLEKRKEK